MFGETGPVDLEEITRIVDGDLCSLSDVVSLEEDEHKRTIPDGRSFASLELSKSSSLSCSDSSARLASESQPVSSSDASESLHDCGILSGAVELVERGDGPINLW